MSLQQIEDDDFKDLIVPVRSGLDIFGDDYLFSALEKNCQNFQTHVKDFYVNVNKHWLHE